MITRPGTERDIPAIVSLLKMSLGESLMPKSQEYWRWKHEFNPFGRSPFLVAEESGALVGVRAFMRWQLTRDGDKLNALRAVDTATHPDHGGKGIFTKLTLKLVEECKAAGDDFIFNTPNEKSRPGYLKMGWRTEGRFMVRVYPRLRLARHAYYDPVKSHSVNRTISQPGLNEFLNCLSLVGAHTNYSHAYFDWRYDKVPVAAYGAVGEFSGAEKFLVIFRIKDTRWWRELRIVESLSNTSVPGPRIRAALKDVIGQARPNLISCAATSKFSHLFPSLSIDGPILTTRMLNTPAPQDWSPSMGDLELF